MAISRRERRFTKLLNEADRGRFINDRGCLFGDILAFAKSGDPWIPDGGETWDLHAPVIPRIPKATIRKLKNSVHLAFDERKAFDYLSEPELFKECSRFTMKYIESRISPRDLCQLLHNDIFELAHECVGAGYVFCVFEEAKRRRRLVHDALTPNVMCADPPNPRFNRIERVQHLVHEGTYAASLDLKCCYYQYALAKAVRKFFAVRNGSKIYQPTRLSMGFKWAVLIANAALKHWCAVAGISALTSDVYVDNVFVVGEPHVVVPKLERLISVLEKNGYTVGSVNHGVRIEHRGMILDMTAKTAELKQGFVDKLFRKWSSKTVQLWGETRSLIGSLIYGLQVLREPPGCLYHVFKFWARNIDRNPAHMAPWWDVVLDQLSSAMRIVHRNTPVRIAPDHREPDEFIVADACTSTGRIAAILFSQGRAVFFVQQSTFTEIAAMEMEAVSLAVKKWAMPRRAINILSDSVVTLAAIAKGLSANFHVNSQATALILWMRTAEVQPVLWYINTKINPADPLTRTFYFDNNHKSHINRMMAISSGVPPHRGLVYEHLFNGSSLPIFRWKIVE